MLLGMLSKGRTSMSSDPFMRKNATPILWDDGQWDQGGQPH